MTEYIFRMGNNPKGWPVVGHTKYEQYPIWGIKMEEDKKEEKPKKVERDDLQEVNVAPPLGYDTWEEYYRDTTRPERY